MKLLQELYFIHSPSGNEGEVSQLVQRELKECGIQDFKVLGNQIYRVTKDTPLVVAHMDQVTFKPVTKLYHNTKDDTISGDSNIGADDKNGVWILLNLLKTLKGVSFIFSDMEERGGNIDKIIDQIQLEEVDILSTIKYCIVFDRRNGSDIIGESNNYCDTDLENDIVELGKKYGYKSTNGFWSDCDIIRNHIPCVNLSCGYYLAHTEKEFTVISDLKNSLEFGKDILKSLTKTYNRTPELPTKSWIGKTYSNFKGYFNQNYPMHNYRDRWYTDYNEEKYQTGGELFYCPFCGEHFNQDEQIIVGQCPICGTSNIEMIGYSTLSCDSKEGNMIEYYYCNHCDAYTDIDDSIIGLEDSPEICRQCGNVKHHFREPKDEDDESCIECPDYNSKLCDDSTCISCPFFSNDAKSSIIK